MTEGRDWGKAPLTPSKVIQEICWNGSGNDRKLPPIFGVVSTGDVQDEDAAAATVHSTRHGS